MCYEEVQAIVAQVAEVLPEPPNRGNAAGYGRWEALVVDTGRQLARLLDADTSLIRSLIADDQQVPAANRAGRRLLLRVTLLAALQLSRTVPPQPRFRGEQQPHGNIMVTTADRKTHRLAAYPRRLDAA